jgi:arylsulfatase A-like enzyme
VIDQIRQEARRPAGAVVALAAICLVLGTGCGRRLPQRPSVLLLTVDTLRADHLGAYGYPRATSPVLDQMASESVRFDLAQSQWPKTGPSFASLLTATYPKDNGIVREIGKPLPCGFRTLAEELRELGYQTGAVVANGAVGSDFFYDQGFEHFVEAWKGASSEAEIEEATRAGPVTDLAIELLAQLDADRPFFLWVHYLDPHFPYRPPEAWRDKFQADGRVATGATIEIDRKHHRRVTGGIGRSQVLDERSDLDFYIARYDAEIAYTDAEIGRLVDDLRRRQLYDRLLTIFTADHGESLGEHSFYFDHGLLPFQNSTRVPLFVRWPGVLDPRVDVDAVELLHLAPTVLESAGRKLDEGAWRQGRSLVPRLLGESNGRDTLAFSEAGTNTRRLWMKSVTDGTFKAVWAPTQRDQRRIGHPGESVVLFNLAVDPGELVNVAAQHPEVAARLSRRLWTWFEAPAFDAETDTEGCGGDRSTAPETVEQLRALGYL